jgi:S-DNA-T family DNA segregation ATPase FtsK/SpoIIIE
VITAGVLGIYALGLRVRWLTWTWERLAPAYETLGRYLGGLWPQFQETDDDYEDGLSPAVAASPASGEAKTIAERRKQRLKVEKRFSVQAGRDDAPARPKKRPARLPSLDLLQGGETLKPSERDINLAAQIIEKTLGEFGLPVKVIDFKTGPAVTQYAVEPGYVERAGPDGEARQYKVRVSQISALANDLALALSAPTIRIEAPVPGHSYVGIEVPNRKTFLVGLRPIMESAAFQKVNAPLAIALGRDVSGAPVAADLASMPHLLIAGTTGSGKSVCITSIAACLVANNTPEDLRLILIDPKMVELVRFNGLPHLYGRVEVELDRILGVLRWCTREMDRRYKLFETAGARNLEAYNQQNKRKKDAERLPRMVVIVDELADLMMMAPDETERTLIRLAQMARATGMHLIVATQRPSTDIVTGLIKANFPARSSFAVASSIDSRVILDTPGAESLLGRGDMLFLSPESGSPVRLQGCFVADREVEALVKYWQAEAAEAETEEVPSPKSQTSKPKPEISNLKSQISKNEREIEAAPKAEAAPWDDMLAREAVVEDKDSQIEQAIGVVKQYGTASASLLQRKLRIGYPRAARLMDELYDMGIVGRPQQGGKTREVLIEEDDDPIGKRAKIIGGEDEAEE